MEEKTIKIKVFTFNELNERVKKMLKRKVGRCFKETIKDDTLFLSNGTFFDKDGLKFLGLSNFEVV